MKILYFFLLVAAAIFYPMFKDNLSFMLLLCLLLFPVFMIAVLLVIKSKLEVDVTCSEEIPQRNDTFSMKINIDNRSIFPVSSCVVTLNYNMKTEDRINKYSVTIPIGALSSETVVVSLKSEHCGMICCNVPKIRVYDFIGLFGRNIRPKVKNEVPVLPIRFSVQTYVEKTMSADDGSSSFSNTKSGSDSSEVFGLRNYRDGDRQNHIHWKLSSRCDELIVKELSEPVSSRILLIPDIQICGTETERDEIFELYASISDFLSEENTLHEILYCADEIKIGEIQNTAELTDFLICRMSELDNFVEGASLAELFLESEKSASARYSHIILIAPRAEKSVLPELEQLGISDRISMLCTGAEDSIGEDKFSDINVYYTSCGDLPEEFHI